MADDFASIFSDAVEDAEVELQDNFGPLNVARAVFEETIANETTPAFATVRSTAPPLPLLNLGLCHIPPEHVMLGCTRRHPCTALWVNSKSG